MKKHDKLVRFKYDEKRDEYQLLLSTDGGETWDLSVGSVCCFSSEYPDVSFPMYVHCSLIIKFQEALTLGFFPVVY